MRVGIHEPEAAVDDGRGDGNEKNEADDARSGERSAVPTCWVGIRRAVAVTECTDSLEETKQK